MQRAIHRGAYAFLAVPSAEGGSQVDLVLQLMLSNKGLKPLNDLLGTSQVAGAANAYSNFHFDDLFHDCHAINFR